MNFATFENDYRPPMTMEGFYHGSAEGATWCCVRGEGTDEQAIECARKTYGGDWLMPILNKAQKKEWPTNPKIVEGVNVWILRKC